MTVAYEDALFRQKMRRRLKGGAVTMADVADVLVEMFDGDVLEAVRRQKPELLGVAVAKIRDQIAPVFAAQLVEEGWTVR